MTTTYTRIEAAQKFGVSNTIIARNLKAIETMGFDGLVTDENKLTEKAIELIGHYREKNQAALDAALCEQNALCSDSTTDEIIDPEIEIEAPQGLTAGIALRTEAIQANALAISRRTDELRAFEIPVTQIDDVTIDIDELRALVGLSTSRSSEANAYREQADRHQAELEQLQKIQDQLDIERIIADEQAKIEREQAIRSQVRKSLAGKEIKSRAAVA